MTRIDTMPPSHAPELLLIAPQFPPATLGGGPSRTFAAMVGQSSAPERVAVITTDTDHLADKPMDVPRDVWTSWKGASVWYGKTDSIKGLLRTMTVGRRTSARVVYINSLFHPSFSILPLVLNKFRYWGSATLVLAPRGELNPGALRLKSRKKRAFLVAARLMSLHRNLYWHASSHVEASKIRSFGVSDSRILVKENETALPAHPTQKARNSDVAELIYVGRISRSKQIEIVIDALAKVDGDFRLRIIGAADDHTYERDLRRRSAALGPRVEWLGHLSSDEVFTHLDQCTAVALPTAGENFGHVIAEALSRSCPVLVADVTPWTPVIRGGGGIIVPENTSASWARALEDVISDPGSWEERHASAARSYERWRGSGNRRSILDHLLDDSFTDLLCNADSDWGGA